MKLSNIIYIRIFIIVFYIVGLLGFSLPLTFEFFRHLTPWALLMASFLLSLFHNDFNKKTILIFICIYLTGLIIEILGVNTGIIFGQYSYGKSLGPKIWDTPLILGLNWLFLVYVSSSVANKLKTNIILKIFVASLIMLVYDVVLEQVADNLDMWYWHSTSVPLKNYIAWFILSFTFISLIKLTKIKTDNRLAFTVLLSQFFFFLGLFIFY